MMFLLLNMAGLLFFIGLSFVGKIHHITIRSSSAKLVSEVEEYRKEKIASLRNNFTKIDYPYVKIDAQNVKGLIRLRYANSWSKSFEIGEKVHVFWHKDELLYWDAYNVGFYKYLPKNWSWNK